MAAFFLVRQFPCMCSEALQQQTNVGFCQQRSQSNGSDVQHLTKWSTNSWALPSATKGKNCMDLPDDETLTVEGSRLASSASVGERVLVIGCGAIAREILAVVTANGLSHVDLTLSLIHI